MPRVRNCGPRWTAVTYKSVADVLAQEPNSGAKRRIMIGLTAMFKADNPNFSMHKFEDACAYAQGDNKHG